MSGAFARGIRLFDTAPLYGSGLGERRVGGALQTYPRDEFVLATKVGRLLRSPQGDGLHEGVTGGASGLAPQFDFSYDGVMKSFEESLDRLGLDRVDILHIHDPDLHHDEALTGAFRALDKLRGSGAIRAVGAGMNQVEMLTRFAHEAPFDCFLVAGRYTLLDQSALPELLPECQSREIGVILGGVFNTGLLADPHGAAPMFNYRPADRFWLDKAYRIESVCDRHGVPLKAAALQFPFAHPAITSVLLGARSLAELAENLALLEAPLPAALWEELRGERLLEAAAPTPA